MDETKETTQGTPGQARQSSGGEPGTTSGGEPELIPKELAQKMVSDALSAAGRDAKSLAEKTELANQTLAEASAMKAEVEGAIAKLQQEKDERELEDVRNNPDLLAAYKVRQTVKAKEAELIKREQELAGREKAYKQAIAEIAKSKRERDAISIATKHNVNADFLLEHTDGSSEKMEALAQILPKKGQGQEPALKPDSGITTGGGLPESARGKIRAGFDKLHPAD